MTQKSKKVLEFIINFHIANHYWPSYEQIATSCQISKGAVSSLIRSLVKDKKLIKPERMGRTFIILETNNGNK